jgi:hypothetical protein
VKQLLGDYAPHLAVCSKREEELMSHLLVRLGTFISVMALVIVALCVDLPASAGNTTQNANSSTVTAPPTEPTNMNRPARPRGRRRAAAPAAEATTAPAETAEQTDLSGTYEGTFECSDAGVSGETTLTITGNNFTLSDGKTGRIVASTTRGYTGVAMQFGEVVMATPGQAGTPPVIVSMRARKSGNRLTLSTVPGARRVCTFTPKR